MSERAVFMASHRARPHVDETRLIHDLRATLKALLRQYGWRCLSIIQEPEGEDHGRRGEQTEA
jgi:hypothetical protein